MPEPHIGMRMVVPHHFVESFVKQLLYLHKHDAQFPSVLIHISNKMSKNGLSLSLMNRLSVPSTVLSSGMSVCSVLTTNTFQLSN